MARIYRGLELRELCESAAELERRDVFPVLEAFLDRHPQGKLLALFGLRRTGKTVMMLQAAHGRLDESAFLMAKDGDDMDDIIQCMWDLKNMGCRHFFIDEATAARNFAGRAQDLADEFGMMGCHVILAGTDSLNFRLAETKALGRMALLSTTRIPFAEHKRLFPDAGMEDYVREGGILDRSSFLDSLTERRGKAYRKRIACGYTLSAIAENIQHSLESFGGIWPGRLSELCRMQEMTSLINLCAHYDTHRLLLRTVNGKYASEEVSHFVTAFNSLMDPERLDKRLVARLHRERLSILDLSERQVKLDQDILDEVESLLYDINALFPVVRTIIDRNGKATFRRENVFGQPAVRWGQIETLLDVAASLSPDINPALIAGAGKATFGKILEDAIFLESLEICGQAGLDVCRLTYVNGEKSVEADIVISLPEKKGFCAFEVKSREKADRKDSRHLRNKDFVAMIERLHGPMLDFGIIRPNADAFSSDEIDAGEFILEMLPSLSERMEEMARPSHRAGTDFHP